MGGLDSPRRLAWFGEAGVVLFVLAVPVTAAVNTLTWPGPGPVVAVTVSTALYLPLLLWLAWAAMRGQRSAASGWVLAALVVLMVVSTVWVGEQWTLNYGSLGLAVLLVLPGRWSWLAFAAIVAATLPASWVTGGPPDPSQVALVLQASLGLAPFLLIRLVDAVRDLDAARAAAANAAVARERLQAEENLWRSVGAELAGILALGERAGAPGLGDRVVEQHLHSIVDASRTSLAGARRLVAEYRRGSLRGEIDTATALLRAAGIQTIVTAPSTVLCGSPDQHLRVTL
jgi:two-component system, NarL family, sensor histidine kinase DesK